MKIKAEDTAALIIDFQEKLVPAIADHDEIQRDWAKLFLR